MLKSDSDRRAGWLAGWSVAGRLGGWEAGRLGGGRREAEAGGQEEADSPRVPGLVLRNERYHCYALTGTRESH